MSFGVDTLGGLSEKLKQLSNDNQSMYESFLDATQLFKQGKMGDKEYFAKMGEYLVAQSAMTFLAIRVIFEIKGAMEKGSSIKNPTGGIAAPAAPPQHQAGFGIGGFTDTGGQAGYTLPSPQQLQQQEPTFKPVDIELPPKKATKSCIICGATIPAQAKFCSKCGRSQ
ncbi:zinc ribbon domain-containing protein [Nitrososphaera sp.]|uniref:zinc ribbon domain-containing protein n=1 Tax=Nitrososphaera sp. TaxID=1971748 RepID=UPI00307D290D